MTSTVESLYIKVDTSEVNRGKDALGGFTKAGQAAEDQTKKLNAANVIAQTSIGRYAASFANPITAALAFAAAMVTVGVKAVQHAEEARLSIVKLELIYRNSGKNIGITLKELESNIQSLAASSRFDDEDIRAGAIEFVKFGNIANDVLKSIMQTSVQYAAFTGTNVVQAASAMARAMADPEAASRLLKNAGVALTNTEQKYITVLMESGRMMEAQAVIARKLADTYADVEQATRGFGSSYSEVFKEMGESFEALGKTAPIQFISDTGLDALKMARNLLMDITAALGGEDTKNRFFGRLHPATKGIQESIDAAAKAKATGGGKFEGGVLPSEEKMKADIAAAEASKKVVDGYAKSVTASKEYAAALKLETDQIGMNAVQKRLMADAAEAAKAPTAALRLAIMTNAKALAESTVAAEAAITANKLLSDSVTGLADVGYKQVSSLQQQVDAQNQLNEQMGMSQAQVLDLVGAKELEEAANIRSAAQYAGPFHEAYLQYAKDLETAARLQKELASGKGTADALRDLDKFLDPARAQTFGDSLRGVFDGAGTSLVRLIDMLTVYGIKQAEIEKARKDNIIANTGDAKKYASVAAALTDKETNNRITAFADMSRASKGFAEEGSATYEILTGLEKALYLFQMANMAQKLITSLFLTETQVAGNVIVAESAVVGAAVEGTANMAVAQTAAVAAVANQGKGDPISAWPRIAAMIALMAGIGLMVAGGSASKPVIRMDEFAGRKANDGSGTVLGDAKAQSESIQNSLDALESYAKPGLTYTGQMVGLLREIKNSLSGVTESLFASGFDSLGNTFKAVSKSSNGFMGLGGKSSTSSLSDLGLAFAKQTVGEAIESLKLQEYQVTKTDWVKKGFLGIGKGSGTTYTTTFKDVDASVSAAMTAVMGQIFEMITKASQELGGGQQAQIDNAKLMDTGLGKVSLMGKTGDEIESILAAIFGKMSDSIVKIMMPGIDRFQKVGEGLLETLIRVSSLNEYVNDTFLKLGLSVRLTGDAALDANIAIVDLFGGVEKMGEAISTYTENFYSDAERQAMSITSLRNEFLAMGRSMPLTNAGFRSMVESIDLATASGQKMFVTMMGLSESFAAVTEFATKAANTKLDNAFSALQRAADAERTSIQNHINKITENISKLTNLSGALQSTLSGMSLIGTDGFARLQGQAQIAGILASVKAGGKLPTAEAMSGALSAVSKPSDKMFGSFLDYARDFAKTTSDIAALDKYTQAQISIEEKALAIAEKQLANLDAMVAGAQSQIDALHGIDSSVMSVADAVSGLAGAIAGYKAATTAASNSVPFWDPSYVNPATLGASGGGLGQSVGGATAHSPGTINPITGMPYPSWVSGAIPMSFPTMINGTHANGLASVPFDGYIAQLHKGESVLPANLTTVLAGRMSVYEERDAAFMEALGIWKASNPESPFNAKNWYGGRAGNVSPFVLGNPELAPRVANRIAKASGYEWKGDEMVALRKEINALLTAIALSSSKTERHLKRAIGEGTGALGVRVLT